jgi:hypothetical protein
MIASDHALSPAYPEGLELPPVGCEYLSLLPTVFTECCVEVLLWKLMSSSINSDVNFQDQSRTWPNNDQSRPWLCTVKLQLHTLRILNVFHYGFSESHSKIITHGHYYPPYLVEGDSSSLIFNDLNGLIILRIHRLIDDRSIPSNSSAHAFSPRRSRIYFPDPRSSLVHSRLLVRIARRLENDGTQRRIDQGGT